MAQCIHLGLTLQRRRDSEPHSTASAGGKQLQATAEEAASIQKDYASSIAFLVGALGSGCQPGALTASFARGTVTPRPALLPDADLASKGVPIPGMSPALLIIFNKGCALQPSSSCLRLESHLRGFA